MSGEAADYGVDSVWVLSWRIEVVDAHQPFTAGLLYRTITGQRGDQTPHMQRASWRRGKASRNQASLAWVSATFLTVELSFLNLIECFAINALCRSRPSLKTPQADFYAAGLTIAVIVLV